MTEFAEFLRIYHKPIAGTGRPLSTLGLDGIPFLEAFASKVGTGVFVNAILSVASVREEGIDLAPWMKLVPTGSKHFATNGIGELFFVAPNGKLYRIFVHFGESIDIEVEADSFLDALALPVNEDRYLSMSSFYIRPHKLKPTEVLTYEPPAMISGRNSGADLVPCEQRDNLAALAKLHFGESKCGK